MATLIEPKVKPLTEAVGAVIEGIDIGAPIDAETIAFIRATLVERGVVFFRRQDVTIEQMWDFIARFGTPWKDDSFGADDNRPEDVQIMDSVSTRYGTSIWHSDSSFLAEPPKFTILRAVELPGVGGDTCWASMTAAYDALPAPIQVMLEGLRAVHTIDVPMERLDDYGETFGAAFRAVHAPHQVHPVIAVHPETGRKALYVTESCTSRIVGLPALISRHLLAMLFEHIKAPDFNLRWRWSPGDVAVWDNRTVQHYAVPDYTTSRVMQRIVIKGERPVGP
jgi:taurine dioxygenase